MGGALDNSMLITHWWTPKNIRNKNKPNIPKAGFILFLMQFLLTFRFVLCGFPWMISFTHMDLTSYHTSITPILSFLLNSETIFFYYYLDVSPLGWHRGNKNSSRTGSNLFIFPHACVPPCISLNQLISPPAILHLPREI